MKTFTSITVDGKVQKGFQFPAPNRMDDSTWAALETLMRRFRTQCPRVLVRAVVVTELDDTEGKIDRPLDPLTLVEAFVQVQEASEQDSLDDLTGGLGVEFDATYAEASVAQCQKILDEIKRVKESHRD